MPTPPSTHQTATSERSQEPVPTRQNGNPKHRDRATAGPRSDRSVTMRAVIFDDYGPPDVLHLTKRPIPSPRPGQVLIRVSASSVNPIDYRLRKGEMKG